MARRSATVVSWLAVAGLGLAIGSVGVGGLLKTLVGPGADSVESGRPVMPAIAATTALGSPSLVPSLSLGLGPGDGRTALNEGRVVSPTEVPDGAALTGPAPAAREAQDTGYFAFEPTSLRLPSGRLAPIQPAGVQADGVLEVPPNPDRVGWWTGGAEAGEPYGSIVLAGHVDSADFGVGVLAEMLDMRSGQDLRLGDGKHGLTYRVESIRKVSKARLAAGSDLFDQNLKHRLVMITCGGPYDPKAHRYQDNVVIVAKPRR